MNIYLVLAILAVHFIADFVCQTDWQAKNKSKSWNALLSHTITYTFVFLLVILVYCAIFDNINKFFSYTVELALLITFITHTIIDYFTSRLNTKLWNKGKVHEFFVSVGFDQLLHYTQLLLTYYFLTK